MKHWKWFAYPVGMLAYGWFWWVFILNPKPTEGQAARDAACQQSSSAAKCKCWVFGRECPPSRRTLCRMDGHTDAQCRCWVDGECPVDYQSAGVE